MKLTFEHQELLKSVNIAMKAVSAKTTMPILECILIDATADQIRFISNDMELGIETIAKGNIIERGMVALHAKTFSEIIRRLPSSIVTIETNEKFLTRITCEKAKFDIPGQDGETFAYLPIVERNASVSITQFTLRQMINQTIFSTAASETNKIMTGELFEMNSGNLRIVALDGHRIAIRMQELGADIENRRVIIPGKTLQELSRIIDGGLEDPVTIYFSDNHVIFEFDQTMVLSRLIDGEYFSVDQMLSSDYETKVTIQKQELINCINRASLLVRESDKMPVILNIGENSMQLSINTVIGSMDEAMDIEMEGKDIRIGFNSKFLLDALRVIDDEVVTMYFIGPVAPCYIRDEEGKYNYIVLPVNIAR